MTRKRKSITVPGSRLLRWHMVIFVLGTMLALYSVLATISYPGNAGVPFEQFEPFIINRMTLVVLWGVIFLIHFGIQQIRGYMQLRAYNAHLNTLHFTEDASDTHQRLAIDEEQGQDVDQIVNDAGYSETSLHSHQH